MKADHIAGSIPARQHFFMTLSIVVALYVLAGWITWRSLHGQIGEKVLKGNSLVAIFGLRGLVFLFWWAFWIVRFGASRQP